MSQETYFEPNTSDRLRGAVKASTQAALDEVAKKTTVRVSGEREIAYTAEKFMIDAGPDCVSEYQDEGNVLKLKGSKIDITLDAIKWFTIEVVEI